MSYPTPTTLPEAYRDTLTALAWAEEADEKVDALVAEFADLRREVSELRRAVQALTGR